MITIPFSVAVVRRRHSTSIQYKELIYQYMASQAVASLKGINDVLRQ